MNVFEDQRFFLRSRAPDGGIGEERYLSWHEIMTGEEEVLPFFQYSLEYMNMAALGLCVSLTQAFLEPANATDLIERLDKPVPKAELDTIIEQNKELFGIDEGHRFMQGKEPARDKKGRLKTGDLSEVLLTIKKGEKEFLNRPAQDSAVRLDQVPLLLFARATFFEKSAGRGYLTGTTGDLEIRTFVIDPSSLRNTIWLNVLTHENQAHQFTAIGSDQGYDNWMWISPPQTKETAQGAISLRSGLFWMVANKWIEIEELEESRQCVVTGDIVEAGQRAGTGVVVSATGVGFGATVKREDGLEVRQSFFRHPNGPHRHITPKKGASFDRHLEVQENSGLIGQMGGLFYAAPGSSDHGFHIAPVVEQLYEIHTMLEEDYDVDVHNRYDLLCFGFNMLSSKKNVHGGYKSELFNYPILGGSLEQRTELMKVAEGILVECAKITGDIEDALRQAVQRCIMKEINASDNDGVITYKDKSRVSGAGILRDVSRELWGSAGNELRRVLKEISEYKTSAEDIERAEEQILTAWTKSIYDSARKIFLRYFDDYSASPQHLLAAHDARRLFYARIWKLRYSPLKKDDTDTGPNNNPEDSDE